MVSYYVDVKDKELKKHCEFFQSFHEHYTSRLLVKRLDLGIRWSGYYDEPRQAIILCNYSSHPTPFEEIPLCVNDFESFSDYLLNNLIPRVLRVKDKN